MSELSQEEFEKYFPFLSQTKDEELKRQFLDNVSTHYFPSGQIICREGDSTAQLPFVLSGTVRVFKVGENGREITLYRIEEGESCVLTASCILSHIQFPALAIVENNIKAALVTAQILREWTKKYDAWREYAFGLMSKRLSDVIATVEEITFKRVDERIAEFLVKKTEVQDTLNITHQDIAHEIGTVREVVSRILKDLERAEIISLSRGAIGVLNKSALKEKLSFS